MSRKEKCFRLPDGTPGPDYLCSKCTARGVRLWRNTHAFLDAVDLLCFDCATRAEAANIKRYASFTNEHDCTIGNLVPARATPEGDTLWGHCAGEVEWWYALPQHPDAEREMALLRRERDRNIYLLQWEQRETHELRQRTLNAEQDLKVERQTKVPANAKRWRDVLLTISRGEITNNRTGVQSYAGDKKDDAEALYDDVLQLRIAAELAIR